MTRLPRTVPSMHGPVKVLRESPSGNVGDTVTVLGEFCMVERVIRIHPDLPETTAWTTLWHEMTHLLLWDSGIHNLLTPEVEEAICDAAGSYLTLAGSRVRPQK